ncbi:SDR family NAD(P)-dependent oxidoreductase [Millisia brevis]|uniref:SDR family NAD(P)-dependent oxidoreductase n=1 Tax=Millisia brevis TaxID=264148 RepID=UPI000836AD3D|nr:SDR family oxidoreductase [Millisia brevis]
MNPHDSHRRPTALITGGSSGLGLALARALDERGWTVVVDGRDPARLLQATIDTDIIGIAGNIADPGHRADLIAEVRRHGPLDLLVNNASTLGPLPMRPAAALYSVDLRGIWAVNVDAPHELARQLMPALVIGNGILIAVTSDAAVHHYPNWGGYGASKAALEHLTLTAATEADITGYAIDPGDMRTRMHADAAPGEDLSQLPDPAAVVPYLLAVLDQRPPSGRYRLADVPTVLDRAAGGAS